VGGPPGWGLNMGLTTPTVKNKHVTNLLHEPGTWTDSFDKRPKRQIVDMTFGTWNIICLYRAGSLVLVSKELKNKLDLVGVQVRWEGGGTVPAGEYTFCYGKGNENHELGTGFFVHKRILPAFERVEFISDRMSYIILRGHWCHHIVPNVHSSTEDKIDYVKDSFYEELERVFHKAPKYHMKILLGNFNAKVGRENIFKLTIWNESLHELSNDKGVNLPHQKISESKVQYSHISDMWKNYFSQLFNVHSVSTLPLFFNFGFI
jgi:hypothetical protein